MSQLTSYLSSALNGAKRAATRADEVLQRSLATVGIRQAEATIAADSQRYWRQPRDGRWKANSHWRDSEAFEDAVHFAPRCEEFIGVDISVETLDECRRQVKTACDTRFRATKCGLTPHAVQLVPKNELDERYAYFLMTNEG